MRKISNDALVGKKFGRWTVIDGERRFKNRTQLLCVCECGNERFVDRGNVINGLSKGCIKCRKMSGPENPAYVGTENIPGNYWGILRRSAADRGVSVEVTIQELDSLLVSQRFKCALSGLPISFSGGKKGKKWTASVDRIDSGLGYKLDNVQFVHKDVNLMKNHFHQDRFIEICKLVAARS